MGRQAVKIILWFLKKSWDFPGGLMVKTSPSNAGYTSLIPSQGVKVPHALESSIKT